MAKKKQTVLTRRALLLHRLGSDSFRLRSRIYRQEENITNNKFSEIRDIGSLPYTWDDFGFRSEVQYIHSTVRGFNQDYKALTKTYHLENLLDTVYVHWLSQLIRERDILKDTAARDKQAFFGAPSPDTPLKETPYVQSLLNPSNEEQTNATTIMHTMQEMKAASNFYTFESETLQRIYHEDYHTNREQYYQRIVDYIWEAWQNFCDLPWLTSDQKDLEYWLEKMEKLDKEIGKEKLGRWVRTKRPDSHPPFAFSSKLGLLYEDAIRVSILDYLAQQTSMGIVERIGQKNGLVDVALTQGKPTAETTLLVEAPHFTGGISAKLRAQNQFNIDINQTPRDFIQQLTGSSGDGKITQAFDALRYLYNNWVALSVFNNDAGRSYTNAVGRTARMKRATLVNGGHLMGKTLNTLAEIINLILIHSAFFANSKDVNDTVVFNPKYWSRLLTLTEKTGMTIPNFVFTQTDYYETWQLVQYYMENKIITAKQLFTDTDGYLSAAKGYDVNDLKELYNIKAKALRLDRGADRLMSDLGLYDVLHTSNDMTRQLQNIWYDAFKVLLSLDRKISVKFRLVSSSELNYN